MSWLWAIARALCVHALTLCASLAVQKNAHTAYCSQQQSPSCSNGNGHEVAARGRPPAKAAVAAAQPSGPVQLQASTRDGDSVQAWAELGGHAEGLEESLKPLLAPACAASSSCALGQMQQAPPPQPQQRAGSASGQGVGAALLGEARPKSRAQQLAASAGAAAGAVAGASDSRAPAAAAATAAESEGASDSIATAACARDNAPASSRVHLQAVREGLQQGAGSTRQTDRWEAAAAAEKGAMQPKEQAGSRRCPAHVTGQALCTFGLSEPVVHRALLQAVRWAARRPIQQHGERHAVAAEGGCARPGTSIQHLQAACRFAVEVKSSCSSPEQLPAGAIADLQLRLSRFQRLLPAEPVAVRGRQR